MFQPTGLIEITGEHDAGKTLAALFVNYEGGYPLKDIAFIHDDVKEPGYKPDMFGLYVDLVKETKGMKLFQRREFGLKIIDSIKPKQFKAIVWDTWFNFGESIQNYVVNNRYKFRSKDEFIMAHETKVIGAQTWRDAHNDEASVASYIKSLCNVFIVTSHLKDSYVGGVKCGKTDQLGKSWDRICNMRLWLKHNPNGEVPVSLVLKRPHKPGLDDNGKPVSVSYLPRRFAPQPEHKSIWDTINYYYDNPANHQQPAINEIPTPFELSILDGILTPEQKEIWRAEVRAKEQQEKEESTLFDMQLDTIKQEFIDLKLPAAFGFPALKEKYPLLTFEQVQQWDGQ